MSVSLLRYFKGNWSFIREIRKFDNNLYATAQGNVEFVLFENNKLYYKEKGQLVLENNKTKLSFFRSYLYEFIHNGFKVYYADGPSSGSLYQEYKYDTQKLILLPVEAHLCGLDCYKSFYSLLKSEQFSIDTVVQGPKKDYTISTIFSINSVIDRVYSNLE